MRALVFRAGFLLVILASIAPRASAVPLPSTVHPAAAIFDNDDRMAVNSLDMFVTNHGSFAWDLTGNPGLIYPRGTTKAVLYAAGLWVGAKVNGATRVAMGAYVQEYGPGPMSGGTYQADQPSFHNFAFDALNPLSASDLADYTLQGGPVDGLGDPLLFGSSTVWSVFNDANPVWHTNVAGSTIPLGIEVQQTVCAYAASGALSRTVFLKWRLIQKGAATLDSTYVSVWCDPDVGGFGDDLVGCDTTLALGYCYNATNSDLVYGSTPPAVGMALIHGPVVTLGPGVTDTLGMTSFQKYINGTDPNNADETYAYMRGRNKDGSPMHILDDPLLPVTQFTASGLSPSQPSTSTNWLDSNSGDRRMMITTGPFTMAPGDAQEVIVAICVGQGSDRLSSITSLKSMIATAVLAAPPPTPPVSVAAWSADVTLEPRTLSLSSRAPWVLAVVEPAGVSPGAIDASAVRLGGVPADPDFAEIGDRDQNGRLDLTLRFSRAALDPRLVPGAVSLDVSGSLRNGDTFAGTATLLVTDPRHAPLAASLAPNPMNPSGTLRFVTTRTGPARVTLYDARGRRVRELASEPALSTGAHELPIDGRDGHGRPLASGVYWFRIEAVEGIATGRVVLLE